MTELIATYRGNIEAAKEVLLRETWGWQRRSLHAALVMLAGEGDTNPLRELAEAETMDEPQLEIAKFGAGALLGVAPSRWEPERLRGCSGISEDDISCLQMAVALIGGDSGAIQQARKNREHSEPRLVVAEAALEALRFAQFEPRLMSQNTVRLDLASQVGSWLPGRDSIVAVGIALAATGHVPEAAQELVRNGFWALSEAIGPRGPEGITVEEGHETYSAKGMSLLYTAKVIAKEPSDCSRWLTWFGFSRVLGLVEEILEGDIVVKDLRGDRATKKKLLQALGDEEFTVGLRIPEAERVLTAGAITAIEQRLAATESWMHTAFEKKVRCRFRLVRE